MTSMASTRAFRVADWRPLSGQVLSPPSFMLGGRNCEGFRMPAGDGGATNCGGRRPKASKGGNRGWGTYGGATGSMGIWPRCGAWGGLCEAVGAFALAAVWGLGRFVRSGRRVQFGSFG